VACVYTHVCVCVCMYNIVVIDSVFISAYVCVCIHVESLLT
jgi:hypothetical protein